MKTATKTALVRLGVFAGVAVLMVEPSFAQGSGSAETMLNTIVSYLTGAVGKSLAVLALIMTAITWMFGAIDMRQAGSVFVGIVVLASATLCDYRQGRGSRIAAAPTEPDGVGAGRGGVADRGIAAGGRRAREQRVRDGRASSVGGGVRGVAEGGR